MSYMWLVIIVSKLSDYLMESVARTPHIFKYRGNDETIQYNYEIYERGDLFKRSLMHPKTKKKDGIKIWNAVKMSSKWGN